MEESLAQLVLEPEGTNIAQDAAEGGLPSPHSTFYLSGQSVVFQVEDTLFKVDPALFTVGEDSVLKTMLSLPRGDNPDREGSIDSTPIILHGDTVAQWDMLLWGLHSQTLFQARVSEDDVDRHVTLAKISHKYDLRGLEAWATSGLTRLAQANASVRMSQAAPLLDTFYLCSCTDASKLILETVKVMLHTRSLTTAEITAFISIGHRYSLPGLTSLGYYTMMLKSRSEWEAEVTFSRSNRCRLLNGYYTLSEYSLDDSIESLRIKFAELHVSWGSAWSTYTVPSKQEEIRKLHSLKSVDIVGRLRQLVEAFLKDTPAARSEAVDTHKSLFRGHLERIVDDLFETKFSMYFVDV